MIWKRGTASGTAAACAMRLQALLLQITTDASDGPGSASLSAIATASRLAG